MDVSKNAAIRLDFLQDAAVVASTPGRPREKGSVRIRERIPAIAGGTYTLQIAAADGVDTVTVPAGDIHVAGPATPAVASPSGASDRTPDGSAEAVPTAQAEDIPIGLLVAVVVALLAAAVAFGATRRRGVHRR